MLITPWGAPLAARCRYQYLREGALLYVLRGTFFGRRQRFKSQPPFPRVAILSCAPNYAQAGTDVQYLFPWD